MQSNNGSIGARREAEIPGGNARGNAPEWIAETNAVDYAPVEHPPTREARRDAGREAGRNARGNYRRNYRRNYRKNYKKNAG